MRCGEGYIAIGVPGFWIFFCDFRGAFQMYKMYISGYAQNVHK